MNRQCAMLNLASSADLFKVLWNHYLSKNKSKPWFFYSSKSKKYFLSKLLK